MKWNFHLQGRDAVSWRVILMQVTVLTTKEIGVILGAIHRRTIIGDIN